MIPAPHLLVLALECYQHAVVSAKYMYDKLAWMIATILGVWITTFSHTCAWAMLLL